MSGDESEGDGAESHVAVVYGNQIDNQIGDEARDPAESEPVLVRVHTHCLAGDVFGATLCDCRALVDNSLRMIAEQGQGALVYLHNGARGFGIDRIGVPGSGGAAAPRLGRRQSTKQRAKRGLKAYKTEHV